MQERAGAARGDLLHALCVLVALVEVEIASEEHARLAIEYLLLEVARTRVLRVARLIGIRVLVDPARLGNAEYEACSVVHARRDLLEVLNLRLVELGAQLQVDGEQPPVGG